MQVKHCKISLKGNESTLSNRQLRALESHGNLEEIYLNKEGGCERCNFTGSSRRFAIAEVVVCDEKLMGDFVDLGTIAARKNYRARPGSDLPMLDQALVRVFAGLVDPRSVEEAIELILPNTLQALSAQPLGEPQARGDLEVGYA